MTRISYGAMTVKGSVGAVPDDAPTSHYFDVAPGAPSARRTVALTLPDLAVELVTDRGVFSGDHVDAGTRVLLLDAPRPRDEAVDLLDLGCGYGPVSVTLARRAPQARIWAVDVNERALALTAENAKRLGLDNVRAVSPDDVPSDVMFAGIWSNPPVRVGKGQLHDLLRTWLRRLETSGHAYLVVQKNLGADSLQRWLRENGFPASRASSKAGYRVLDVAAGVTG